MMRRRIGSLTAALTVLTVLMVGANAHAWHLEGRVLCDANGNGTYDTGDTPVAGVRLVVVDEAGTLLSKPYQLTPADGSYWVWLPHIDGASYVASLDPTTLPADATIIDPTGGEFLFTLTATNEWTDRDWLIDSATCRKQACWLTGGGVKFSTVLDAWVAERGPKHNFGGNVFPSCSPEPGEPGDGGQWNHVDHEGKLHFTGTSIQTVACGNVPGIEPGSESPVTPYNYIEYIGIGTVRGIKGSKVPLTNVSFFARAEDHNEPGNANASAGAEIDRYYLHVQDTAGKTLILVDGDGNPSTVDPVEITGGNLQLHISSCGA